MEPQSPQVGVGGREEEGKVVSGGGWVLVFFLPLFYSKVFLHMTQTSLNFPKLQSLLMAWPQSGRENVKSGGKKKKNKTKQFVRQLSIVLFLLLMGRTELTCAAIRIPL